MSEAFAETIREILNSHSEEIQVYGFGRITRVNAVAGTPTVDVQPVIRRRLVGPEGETVIQPPPIVQGVPVLYLQAGPFGLSMPLVVGGTVLLLFGAQDFTGWFLTGQDSDPLYSRAHAPSNAVALPLGFSRGNGLNAANDALTIHGSLIRLGSPTAALKVAVAELVKAELSRIVGDFNSHIHVTPSGNSAIPTVPMAGPGDIHTSALRVDS
jgi:hypothetical protein